VTASVRSALQPLAAGLTDAGVIALSVGGRGYDLDGVTRRLVDLAYHRVDMVSRRGEFAVRGGILDVFPPAPTTRIGSSSSATRSIRSARSPSPTSALCPER
jgi:transcription-repair coupling factor (superfamily II helicase)